MNIDEKLDKILPKIELLFENKSIGNEIGYYIFDYDPKYEIKVRTKIKFLEEKQEKRNYNFNIVVFDLFDIIIEILECKNYLDKTFKFEKIKGKKYTNDKIQKSLRLSSKRNLIIKYILDNTKENSVVFITGVGKVYPILKSQHLLKNLNLYLKDIPVILFFPGEYNEDDDLILFKKINEGNYYQATKLIEED